LQPIGTDIDTLNDLQREAVVSEDKRLLVLAGAGSGKTKTLLQKLIYLIEEKGVSPSSILAVTFTKNAANEMIDRLIVSADETGKYEHILSSKTKSWEEKNEARRTYSRKYKWIEGLTLRTFHGFCYSVLRNFGVNEFDNRFRVIGDEKKGDDDDLSKFTAPETIFEVFHKILIEQCADSEYLLTLKRYILDYIVDKVHHDKFRRSLPKDGKYFTTLNGTKVRSKSEQFIADWLYRHNIAFEYEPLLNVKKFDFNPDFFIPAANLYIEHLSSKSFAMRDKEEQFEQGKLLLVRTFESMTKDSALFNYMLDQVVKNRLPANYQTTVALSFMEEFNTYHEDVKDFLAQVIRITDMIKVENMDLNQELRMGRKRKVNRMGDVDLLKQDNNLSHLPEPTNGIGPFHLVYTVTFGLKKCRGGNQYTNSERPARSDVEPMRVIKETHSARCVLG
jgi:DNA helicase-4